MKVLHTHCRSGRHLLTPETTYIEKKGRKNRHCLICRREKGRQYNNRNRFFNKVKNMAGKYPKILRNPSVFKASDLKKIDIGSCYLAEIRAAQQSGIKAPQLNNDQAGIRRMSALFLVDLMG